MDTSDESEYDESESDLASPRAIESATTGCQTQQATTEHHVENLVVEKQHLLLQLEEREKENQKLKDELKTIHDGYKKRELKLQDQITEETNKGTRTSYQVQRQSDELKDAEEKLSVSQQRVKELETQLAAREEELAASTQKQESVVGSFGQWKQTVADEWQHRDRQWTEQYQKVTSRLAQAVDERQSHKSVIRCISALAVVRVHQLRKQLRQTTDTLRRIEAHLHERVEEEKTQENGYKPLGKEIDLVRVYTDVVDLRASAEHMRGERDQAAQLLSEERGAFEEEVAEWKDKYHAAQSALTPALDTVSKVDSSLDHMSGNFHALKHKLEACEQDLHLASQAKDKMEGEMLKAKHEAQVHRSQVLFMQEHAEILSLRLSELDGTFGPLVSAQGREWAQVLERAETLRSKILPNYKPGRSMSRAGTSHSALRNLSTARSSPSLRPSTSHTSLSSYRSSPGRAGGGGMSTTRTRRSVPPYAGARSPLSRGASTSRLGVSTLDHRRPQTAPDPADVPKSHAFPAYSPQGYRSPTRVLLSPQWESPLAHRTMPHSVAASKIIKAKRKKSWEAHHRSPYAPGGGGGAAEPTYFSPPVPSVAQRARAMRNKSEAIDQVSGGALRMDVDPGMGLPQSGSVPIKRGQSHAQGHWGSHMMGIPQSMVGADLPDVRSAQNRTPPDPHYAGSRPGTALRDVSESHADDEHGHDATGLAHQGDRQEDEEHGGEAQAEGESAAATTGEGAHQVTGEVIHTARSDDSAEQAHAQEGGAAGGEGVATPADNAGSADSGAVVEKPIAATALPEAKTPASPLPAGSARPNSPAAPPGSGARTPSPTKRPGTSSGNRSTRRPVSRQSRGSRPTTPQVQTLQDMEFGASGFVMHSSSSRPLSREDVRKQTDVRLGWGSEDHVDLLRAQSPESRTRKRSMRDQRTGPTRAPGIPTEAFPRMKEHSARSSQRSSRLTSPRVSERPQVVRPEPMDGRVSEELARRHFGIDGLHVKMQPKMGMRGTKKLIRPRGVNVAFEPL